MFTAEWAFFDSACRQPKPQPSCAANIGLLRMNVHLDARLHVYTYARGGASNAACWTLHNPMQKKVSSKPSSSTAEVSASSGTVAPQAAQTPAPQSSLQSRNDRLVGWRKIYMLIPAAL